MKYVLPILHFVYGLIHFIGFAKAYEFGNMAQFTKEISKPMGLFWLFAGLLCIVSAILISIKKHYWPTIAIVAVSISQFLIFTVWTDAKYGTIVNSIILIAAIIGYATYNFENRFKKDVLFALEKMRTTNETITEEDL